MLVNNPQSVVAGGQNERFAQLRQRAEGAQLVQVGGCLFGFHQSGRRRGAWSPGDCASGIWGAAFRRQRTGRLEQRCRSLAPCLLIVSSPSAWIQGPRIKGQPTGKGR